MNTVADNRTAEERMLPVDLQHLARRIQPDQLHRELLVKAAKFHHQNDTGDLLRALDATAGLGQDSMLLAAAGFKVDLYERNPETAGILQNILETAEQMPELKEIRGRLCFHKEDSVAAMRRLAAFGQEKAPDLVYLDPMFPPRRKSSKVKKKMQLLQAVEDPCDEEGAEELLGAALALEPRRIVIKRPIHGPHLAGRKPSYSIKGKVIRYDCIVLRT